MVKLPAIFSNGALYQQKVELLLRGRATPGAAVSARILREGETLAEAGGTADGEGRFSFAIATPEASCTPCRMVISDGEETVLENILFGELWLATGQSNMEMPISMQPDEEKYYGEIGACPCIRVFAQDAFGPGGIERDYPFDPEEDLPGTWLTSGDPGAWRGVSALAAKAVTELARSPRLSGVPVGFVHSVVGGTFIETWLPYESLIRDEASVSLLREENRFPTREGYNHEIKFMKMQQCCALYNLKIEPLRGLRFRGMWWYQGEANAGGQSRRAHYLRMMRELHRVYAGLFKPEGAAHFPVISSHLFAYAYSTQGGVASIANINDVFTRLAREAPEDYACVPVCDLPPVWSIARNNHPIHPAHKYALGARFARVTESLAYGRPGMTCPATLRAWHVEGDRIIAEIDTHGQPLSFDGEPRGFYICGEDQVFREARGEQTGPETVALWCPEVKKPVCATYLYGQMQMDGNGRCGEMPLAPFATDPDAAYIRVRPKPWLDPGHNRQWVQKEITDVKFESFYYPVWECAPGTHTVEDDVFCESGRSLRIYGDANELEVYTAASHGQMLDLFNYAKLTVPVFNAEQVQVRAYVTLPVGKDEERIIRIPVLERNARSREWTDFTFDLSGLPAGELESRLTLRFACEKQVVHTVWMDRMTLWPKEM